VPRTLGFVLGIALLTFTWVSVVFALVVPRTRLGPNRLSIIVNRSVRLAFIAASRSTQSYERKDAILAPLAPVAVLTQLVVWLFLIGISCVLMLASYTDDLGTAVVQIGDAMFTLGQATVGHPTNDVITILAAASGFIVIALQIAYLPALYAAFNRRETLITLLSSRAGEPAWGPEILIRHQLVGTIDALPDFYASWEQWAAEVSESHTTYPALLLFRSPDPWASWVIAQLSVLDAAAMQLALCPSTAPSQARLCLRMGYTSLRRIADSLGWKYDDDPMPDAPIQLAYEEFALAVQLLVDTGFPIERDAESAWPHFHGWRVNYESLAYRWADRVVAPPAPWSGFRSDLREQSVAPNRPAHRSPPKGPAGYQRPDF
jgi:hypothetical protein